MNKHRLLANGRLRNNPSIKTSIWIWLKLVFPLDIILYSSFKQIMNLNVMHRLTLGKLLLNALSQIPHNIIFYMIMLKFINFSRSLCQKYIFSFFNQSSAYQYSLNSNQKLCCGRAVVSTVKNVYCINLIWLESEKCYFKPVKLSKFFKKLI